MPAYDFKGLDKAGKDVSGVRDADNEKALRSLLKREGIFLTSIGKGRKAGQSLLSVDIDFGFLQRVGGLDIAVFTRQLATLTKAGIPLVDALAACVDQIEQPKLRKVIARLRQDVSEGSSLAVALSQHPKIFTPIFPNMVRAGEASGTLDAVLLRLAEFTEGQVKLTQKVTSAMLYPILMVMFGGLILTGMFAFVIPQMTQIFEDSGQELPVLTRALIAMSQYFRDYWWVLILLLIGAVWGFRKWKNTPKGKRKWDRRKLSVPIFGPLSLMIGVSRFTKTLATLLRSGVPLLTALDITKNVLNNVVLTEVVDNAREAVKEGASLAEPLKRSGRFPPMVTHMVAVGEQSGALDEMLSVVAEAYETQVDNRISMLTSLLEPVMIIGMGGTVGIIVFAILLPILQLNEFVQ